VAAQAAWEGEEYDNGKRNETLSKGWSGTQGQFSQDVQWATSFWQDTYQIF